MVDSRSTRCFTLRVEESSSTLETCSALRPQSAVGPPETTMDDYHHRQTLALSGSATVAGYDGLLLRDLVARLGLTRFNVIRRTTYPLPILGPGCAASPTRDPHLRPWASWNRVSPLDVVSSCEVLGAVPPRLLTPQSGKTPPHGAMSPISKRRTAPSEIFELNSSTLAASPEGAQ